MMFVLFNNSPVVAINGAGTVFPTGAPEFTVFFLGDRVVQSLVCCVMFCGWLICFVSSPSFGDCIVCISSDYRIGVDLVLYPLYPCFIVPLTCHLTWCCIAPFFIMLNCIRWRLSWCCLVPVVIAIILNSFYLNT